MVESPRRPFVDALNAAKCNVDEIDALWVELRRVRALVAKALTQLPNADVARKTLEDV